MSRCVMKRGVSVMGILPEVWGVHSSSVASAMSDSLWPHGPQSANFLCSWDSPAKYTGVGCHAFLQETFLTQGWKLHLLHFLHCRWVLYPLSHWQSPYSLRTDSKFIYLTRTDSSVCTAKETINKMKWQPLVWEKIIANGATDKGLICKIYKWIISSISTHEFKNKPIKTWAEDLNRYFSKDV